MTKKTKAKSIPLIVENHPEGYEGYPFVTLIRHQHKDVLAIVDDSDSKKIDAYILDLCGPERVDEEAVIQIACEWWETNRERFPLSFEFSRRGVASITTLIHRSYNVDFVSRVIGPLPEFGMKAATSVKRRRRRAVPNGVEVKPAT